MEVFCQQVFAYGQTGSGKTYTMGTALSAKQMLSAKDESIISRALHIVFEALTSIAQEYSIIMKVTTPMSHIPLCEQNADPSPGKKGTSTLCKW